MSVTRTIERADDRPPVEEGLGSALRLASRHHFSPFKFYINRPQKLVVVLNPKVGTKSIRHALTRGFREHFGWRDASNGRYRLFKKAREFPFAPLRDYLHALAHRSEYEFVCFVRNPYARMRSAWLHKLAFGHESGYSKSVRRQILKPVRSFARENRMAGGEIDSLVPFSTFVAFVESGAAGNRDHHWDEQYSVLFMDAIGYRHLFKLETQFHEGMSHILRRIGFAPSCIDDLIGTHRNRSTQPEAPVFNEEFAARARKIYARDFEALEYDENSWRGL